jgi:aldose 1-epimerase
MFSRTSALLLAASSLVAAQVPVNGSDSFVNAAFKAFSGDPLQKYELSASGIRATFIPYGARLTSLFVCDKNGDEQDIVLGYDNAADYIKNDEGSHNYFGPIVGRYANRYVVSRILYGHNADNMYQN